jgi:hypothetical protein
MNDTDGQAWREYREMADASAARGRAALRSVEGSHRVNRCEGR